MKKIKVAILICMALIAGTGAVILWLNLREKSASEEAEVVSKISADGADAHLERIRLVEDKQGQKTWELEARSIQQYQGQNILMLEEVKLKVFTNEGRSFVISGNKGRVYQDSKDMELTGDVVLNSSDGYQLKTHSLSYHHSEKRVTTSDPVEIEGEQIRLVGRGIWVDMEAEIFKILDHVRTQWRKKGKG